MQHVGPQKKLQDPTFRGIIRNSLQRVSVETSEKIKKIIDEDQKKTLGYTYMNPDVP